MGSIPFWTATEMALKPEGTARSAGRYFCVRCLEPLPSVANLRPIVQGVDSTKYYTEFVYT
jgi:hypothetical protein